MASCNDCGKTPKIDCKSYPDAHCINYSGANLNCIGVTTNDRLDTILSKIDSKLCISQSNNHITINAGVGITITGEGEQDIASNPVYTISAVSTFTAEDAQDAVGSSLVDTLTIDLTYNDTLNEITADLIVSPDDITATQVLVWDGSKVFSRNISSLYSDEQAQDAIGGILNDTPTINLTYLDASNSITADVIVGAEDNSVNTVLGWNGTSIVQRLLSDSGIIPIDSFTVGDAGKPQAGDSTYSNSAITGKNSNEILVFLDGLKVKPDKTDRMSWSITGSSIEFTAPLQDLATVEIYVTTIPAVASHTIYYGSSTTTTAPDEAAILSTGFTVIEDASKDVTINWVPFNTSPQYLWFAIPDLGFAFNKTHWYVTALNNGDIGGTSNLFGDPASITINGDPYLIWITNYQTQFTFNCQLS